jgi:hypothetical protein
LELVAITTQPENQAEDPCPSSTETAMASELKQLEAAIQTSAVELVQTPLDSEVLNVEDPLSHFLPNTEPAPQPTSDHACPEPAGTLAMVALTRQLENQAQDPCTPSTETERVNELKQPEAAMETAAVELVPRPLQPEVVTVVDPLFHFLPKTEPPPQPRSVTINLEPVDAARSDFALASAIAMPRLPESFRSPEPEQPPPPLRPAPSEGRQRTGLPKWVVPTIVALVVVLSLASSVQKIVATPDNGADFVPPKPKARSKPAKAAEPNRTPEPEADLPDGLVEHPFARFVEIAQLRVVQVNGRPQVQYLVENHGPQDLTDLGLHVAVRPAKVNASAKPLFSLEARVPTLKAREAKEIRTDLDASVDLSPLSDPDKLNISLKVTLQQ